MPQQTSREQLLRFLDEKVFQPALNAQPLAYSDSGDRKRPKSVRHRVHESRIRYIADYPTATDIKVNFTQDLHSKPGQALANDMFLLKLTRFEDVREEFQLLCQKLGV